MSTTPLCWWCCHHFDDPPLKLPYKYDARTSKFLFCGNFCSWSCMKAHTFDKYGLNMGGIIMGNIVILRKKVYNIVTPIRSAPWRFSLKVFGGTLTIEEFRKNETKDTPAVVASPFTDEKTESVDFVKRVTQLRISDSKMQEISSSVGSNETLRLKRTKPLKRDENNLEKTLGITRKKT